eukprot:2519585-Karenia_brevis.AAC.1
MVKRHEAARAREAGQPWPWTKDERLQKGRYCNIHRCLDPTTKFLASELTGVRNLRERILNAALFQMVGTVMFWEACVCQTLTDFNDAVWRPISEKALELVKNGKNPFTRAYNKPRYNQGQTLEQASSEF